MPEVPPAGRPSAVWLGVALRAALPVSCLRGAPASPVGRCTWLVFDQLRHGTFWKGLQEKTGAEPCAGGLGALLGSGAAGSTQGHLPHHHSSCRPPNVTKRLETHSYFGRAFGPRLHALFFPCSPKCGARQSADVSPNKNRFDLSGALRPDVLMLSAKPRSRARSSVGGCLEKMSRRSFFSRPFRSELWGLKAGSKRSYK